MVVSGRSSPVRPPWSKAGSWRKYINAHSNRKLQVDLDLSCTEERHVYFDTEPDRIQEVPEEEPAVVEERWYKKSDYESFERDRQLTALQYRTKRKAGLPWIEREHSVRGLESLLETTYTQVNVPHTASAKGKITRTTERSKHLKRVLQEQSRQRAALIFPDTTMMRDVSCKSSREARQRSAELGEADALAGYVSSSRALQRKVGGVMHSISRSMQA